MQILLTGGAGYIGAHVALVLLNAGHDVIVFDNLSNGSRTALERVERMVGRGLVFEQGDIRDTHALDDVFARHAIDAVIHLAGLKSVAESLEQPLAYYAHNVGGIVALTQAMARAGVFTLVFSSSATVYRASDAMPLTEQAATGRAVNAYGSTKLVAEWVLDDLCAADARWAVAVLRYFNPVGAHESGLIGEDPKGHPNNLLPYICQVAVGRRASLSVFGNDYATRDGTGVRDYIHVMDLADGHLAALERVSTRPGSHTWNLGSGCGHSVYEIVAAFERQSGKVIPTCPAPRRAGDLACYWADTSAAARDLGWQATRDIDTIAADAWRWQSRNPGGYKE